MHGILSASVGQEQLLTELLVTHGKVSLPGCRSDPPAGPSASSWACPVGSVQFWNKMPNDLLCLWKRCFTGGVPVCFLMKLKVKLWYFYLLMSGFSLGGCFGLLDALVPPVADLCPMPEGSQSQAVRLPGPAQLLGVTFPLCSPRSSALL